MKPKIQETQFGSITIGGSVFEHDVVIRLSGKVKKRKNAAFAGWKDNLRQRHPVNHPFPAVEIADLKPALAEFLVPPDAVQQFADGGHGRGARRVA